MPGDTAEGEVRIKLVVDDLSKAIVEGVKQGFAEMHGEVEKTKKAAGEEGLAGEVFKGNLYFGLAAKGASLLAEGAKQAWEFTENLAEAAVEAYEGQAKAEKTMSGLLFLMDGGKHSMAELRTYSGGLIDDFEELAIKTGVASSAISETYDNLISRGTMASERAKELTEQMVVVGKVVPGGMSSLGEGMSMIEAGMVRAKNPVVALIAATHMLEGNAKSVAMQMQKMTPEEQVALAEKAIGKQAELLKKSGSAFMPSTDQLKTSFDELKDKGLEAAGKPILDALVPRLVQVRDYLAEHVDAIEAFGSKVGYEVGHLVEVIGDITSGVYDAVHENWDEVATTFDELTSTFRGAWEFAKNNAGVIGHTFKDITVDFIHAMKWVADALESVSKGIISALKYVPGVGSAIEDKEASNAEARARGAAHGVAGEADNATFEASVEAYRKQAVEAGKSSEEIQKTINNMRDWRNQFVSQADAVGIATAHNDFAATAEYLQRAIDANDDGAMKYAVSLLDGSEEARAAFALGEVHIKGGFNELIHVLGEKAPELAAKLKDAANVVKQQGGIKPPGHNINFYGAKFNITQDLRGEDADRVILTFRRDLARSAQSRVQARTGTPFGI